ncbi:Regulator of nonsense transcripts 3A [Heterocephalus glaber]|uniref:Regulator of nonsense transcripts 3A n=1 Tax=Heterocephalus glaber TaxID=10181 RepID=G5B863_HETGA|nr:Regulator of nonsense transcripts 3A [Heterocephalus glaber]
MAASAVCPAAGRVGTQGLLLTGRSPGLLLSRRYETEKNSEAGYIVEHLAFKGTKNQPGNSLEKWSHGSCPPGGLTKEQLEEQLRPLPAQDYFQVPGADRLLYPHLYSRACINFRNPDDILLFRDRFDGYVFMSSKGLEYPAVVEFAPFQKIVRRKLKKRDTKMGSIEDDPEYTVFRNLQHGRRENQCQP